jgi:hypothetical protein
MRVEADVRVVKVYEDGRTPYFFVNGHRSDALTELDVLEELLGEELTEYWLGEEPMYATDLLTNLRGCDTIEVFEDLIEEYPDIVEDSR